MNKFEDTYQHPLIVCKHELDLSDSENLGEFLSKQLKLTIEIDDKLFFKKRIYNAIGTGEARLVSVKSTLIPEKRFHLQLDEIVLFIHTDFIEIKFDIPLDYFHLSELKSRNELLEIDLLKNFFGQLKSIGIDEVHFGIFSEFEKDEGFTYCWKNIYRIMSKYDNYFKLEI
ncbi:MAG: hypothetical protein U0T80_10775 [Flavobacteriaceae bacterium]